MTAIPAADHNEPLVGWTHPPGRELPDFDAALAEMRNVESKLVALEPDWESHARRLRERARRGESRDVLLPEAFALVRLASEKVLGLRHYDEQIVAGMLLARGYIVEMATGEGKTLAATTAAFLEAVTGGRSFIVTVNDYLARRDMEWMGPLFRALGLSVGLVTSHHERNRNMRRYSYAADIVYVTNRELVWDYLRDHLGFQRSDVCLPELPPVIIDEADLVLLDEARIPFIVSGMSGSDDANWDAVKSFAATLRPGTDGDDGDYEFEAPARTATLSDSGMDKVLAFARRAPAESHLARDALLAQISLQVRQMLIARHLVENDDYLVEDGKVVIVDHDSGRPQPGRRWGQGLHEALETLHGLARGRESEVRAQISFQEFFALFPKVSGMTGTAADARAEIQDLYGRPTARVRSHKPEQRRLLPDRVFRTRQAKVQAAAAAIKQIHDRRAPVLVGGPSASENEALRDALVAQGIAVDDIGLLSAQHLAHEARLIARAGVPGRITIATNLAGRGTDILLGGNPDQLTMSDLPPDLRAAGGAGETDDLAAGCRRAAGVVRSQGGLHVVLLQRQRNARRDRQFIGRCARQGDPGSAIAFASLEDELFDRPLTWAFDGAGELDPGYQMFYERWLAKRQAENEDQDHHARKVLSQLDRALAGQRKVFYRARRELLQLRLAWDNLQWSAIERLVEPDFDPGESHTDWFPLDWLRRAVLDRLANLPEPEGPTVDPSEITTFVRSYFGGHVGKRYEALSEKGTASFQGAVLQAVFDSIRGSLGAFPGALAAEFCRIAGLSCIDKRWIGLLNKHEDQRSALPIRTIVPGLTIATYEDERYADFRRDWDQVADDLLSSLLKGVPRPSATPAGVSAEPQLAELFAG